MDDVGARIGQSLVLVLRHAEQRQFGVAADRCHAIGIFGAVLRP
jgi:hypothetical protein